MSFSQRVKEFGAGRTENTTGYISYTNQQFVQFIPQLTWYSGGRLFCRKDKIITKFNDIFQCIRCLKSLSDV